MGTRGVVSALSALVALAAPHGATALPICQGTPGTPGVVKDVSGSGTRFAAIGEATIMSETAEGLALAADVARLEAKTALHADRRIPKTVDNQLQGVRDIWACRDHDKLFVASIWDLETARQAADLFAAMPHESESNPSAQPAQRPGVDQSVFDRLMR